jgi:chromosomal replication initiator protein
VTADLNDIWPTIEGELRRAAPETFEIWLADLGPVSLDGGQLTLSAPEGVRGWVAERFGRLLGACASDVLGRPIDVEVVCAAAQSPGSGAAPPRGRSEPATPEPRPDGLNPKYTFDQFVIGDANRFAHAAALAVAELPGQAYNPLFLYGPPGVGKTHLLHSIGNYVQAHGNGMTVRYTTVERFTNEFVAALQGGAMDLFKGRYRRNDVLLIDDVQFLASKVRTEEEFFHTFNALYETGSQLVLTCDRMPRDLNALEDRLRERFESGLIADIRAPDRATRTTVLRKRVQHDAIALDDDAVLDVVADRIPHNVRALEGALIRVVAFGSLAGRPLTRALAEEVLDGLYPETATPRTPGGAPRAGGVAITPAPVTVQRVQDLVCEFFALSPEELLSPGRTARVAWPRQVAMYLAREHTGESLPSIGRSFGGRNHTTVMHALRRTAARMVTDPDAEQTVRTLARRLTGPDRLN